LPELAATSPTSHGPTSAYSKSSRQEKIYFPNAVLLRDGTFQRRRLLDNLNRTLLSEAAGCKLRDRGKQKLTVELSGWHLGSVFGCTGMTAAEKQSSLHPRSVEQQLAREHQNPTW
jgi:hypothetical protein